MYTNIYLFLKFYSRFLVYKSTYHRKFFNSSLNLKVTYQADSQIELLKVTWIWFNIPALNWNPLNLPHVVVCNFETLGQSVVQTHMTPHTICQRVTPSPRPNTACTIGTDRRGAVFYSRYNCRLSGWTFAFGLCHMLDISSPQTSRLGITGNIHTPPVAVAFRHCCTLKTRADSYWPYQFTFDIKNQDLVHTLSCNQIGTQTNQNYCKNHFQNHFKSLFSYFNLDKNFFSSPFI